MFLLTFCLWAVCSMAYQKDIFHHFPRAQTEGGLTDEALSVQFTLAWETYLNSGVWLDDWGLKQNPSQASFSSVRYQLAFTTYSAASQCSVTPAYRQVCKGIMSDSIDRMIAPVTWAKLIDEQWGPKSYRKDSCSTPNNPNSKWGAASTWPNPVIYQNIMYSGHLAQMAVLYEAVTGNDTYSTIGWDFVYNDTTTFHYNTTKLLDGLALQQLSPNNSQGGIPCEPFLVFTECNEHQNIAFTQYSVAIEENEYYNNAADKFHSFLVNECPKDFKIDILEGWIQGIYEQDAETYFVDDQGDGEWGIEHYNCGYNGGTSGFSGLPNSPPRDVWVASMAFLWLTEEEIDTFVCNDGMIKMLDDRLWKYHPEYDGWVLMNHIDMGIGFGTAIYAIAGKQCLWFNEKAGHNVTEIEERVNGSINYLINKYGANVPNVYNISAPLLQTAHVDNGFGAPIMDTANMLTAMTLSNDSFRVVHNSAWPVLQTSMELMEVDYPIVMVRYAKVESKGVLQFEIVVAVKPSDNSNSMDTKMVVKLDSGANSGMDITKNGKALAKTDYTVVGTTLTINTDIAVDESTVFVVTN